METIHEDYEAPILKDGNTSSIMPEIMCIDTMVLWCWEGMFTWYIMRTVEVYSRVIHDAKVPEESQEEM